MRARSRGSMKAREIPFLPALAVLPLWERAGFGEMNIHGIIALIIGYVGVLALTIGLMRLAFHSAEKGFDDRA